MCYLVCDESGPQHIRRAVFDCYGLKAWIDMNVSSAGYIPQLLKDRLSEAKIPFPGLLRGRS